MSYDRPTKKWSLRDIDTMLEFLPMMEEPGFVAATWPVPEKRDASGNPVMCWPYPSYHPLIHEFISLCYKTSIYTDPYALLPEDPKGLEPGIDVLKVLQSVGDMEKASLGQVRRYLVLCTRGERFCDGYIAGQFESGLIQAALRRLKQIRGGSKKEPAKRAGYE